MKSSESVAKIASALLKAQREIDSAKKDSKNPFFKSKYADLSSVIDACKTALNANGIAVLQPTSHSDGRNFVSTILLHESGEWLSSETEVVAAKANDPQAVGSAISYARRYGLQSMVLLKAEDDDGEAAMSRPASYSAPKPVVSAPVETQPATQAVSETSPAPAAVAAKPSSFRSRPKATAASSSTGDAF